MVIADSSDRDVEIVDVSPRDGLQSDPTLLSTAQKLSLIGSVLDAGIRRLEVVSFVNPTRVPQMADADAVLAGLPRDRGASYIGLVLNRRGFDRAVEGREAGVGVDEINVVVVCTDTFAQKNQNRTTAELISDAVEICQMARDVDLPVSVTLAAAFGCPYEGEVAVERVVDVADQVLAGHPTEIALADSIGVATPSDVRERVAAVADRLDGARLRCHFHNTRNTGIANAIAAVEAGVRVIDASFGGIGGCPFAPNATGNIPTEDVVYALERMGYRTGVNLRGLIGQVSNLEAMLEHGTPGLLAKAGVFPAPI